MSFLLNLVRKILELMFCFHQIQILSCYSGESTVTRTEWVRGEKKQKESEQAQVVTKYNVTNPIDDALTG